MTIAGWLTCLVAAALSGCAMFTCEPVTIVVAQKNEWRRLESQFLGLRTSEVGRVVETRQDVLLREYRVKAESGQWYRIPEAEWRAAEVGKPLDVCP